MPSTVSVIPRTFDILFQQIAVVLYATLSSGLPSLPNLAKHRRARSKSPEFSIWLQNCFPVHWIGLAVQTNCSIRSTIRQAGHPFFNLFSACLEVLHWASPYAVRQVILTRLRFACFQISSSPSRFAQFARIWWRSPGSSRNDLAWEMAITFILFCCPWLL